MKKIFFKRIGIVGVGLIGSSFALAVKERKCADEIWGYSLSGNSAKKAFELGIIDKYINDLALLAKECDLILVSTPVLTIPEILKELSLNIKPETIVTDGGSVKNFVRECHYLFSDKNFIGAHPIAGTEKSGPEAGFSSLFDGSSCVITPLVDSDSEKLRTVTRLWETLGMNVVFMTPEEHDEVMANVSHMPHAVAFSLVFSVKDKYFKDTKFTAFAGGGFKDFTRIAKSDVTMWTDIFLSNSKMVLASIKDFESSLSRLKRGLEDYNRTEIEAFISSARNVLLGTEKK